MNVKLLIISVFLFASAAFAGPKPNIVHIMVDDLGWQDIAAHKIGGDAVFYGGLFALAGVCSFSGFFS
jgi:hypothetical protein